MWGMSILLKSLFGSGVGREQSQRIVQAVEFVLRVAGRGMFLEVPPFVPTPENLRVKRALRDLGRVIDGLIEERRRQGGGTDDLLSLLLAARDADTNTGMSERQLRDEITSVLVAGYETTAVAMTWMFYALSQNPGVTEELFDEIDAVLGEQPFSRSFYPGCRF